MVIPQQISYLIEKHFPAFYREEGGNFVAFVRAYYEWLEETDQVIGRSRTLLDNIDVDSSIDEFINSFKQKYLTNFPLLSETDQRTFVKRATEIYRAKGSQRAIELLFRLLYNEDITVYYPTSNILRASAGKWTTPVYLELSEAGKNKLFVGNKITGSTSGATAIVSKLAKRTIAGKTFDVAYLTNIEGNFSTDELVTYDGIIDDSPTVIGSLNDILIENAGQNFEVGEEVTILSDATGRQGAGRVTEIVPATGKIDYNLYEGGSGYTLTSNVVVSEKVITYTNFISNSVYTTAFAEGEQIKQDLTYAPFIASNRDFALGQFVYGTDTASNPDVIVSSGYIVGVTQNTTTHIGSLIINEVPSSTVALNNITNANTTGSFVVGERLYQLASNTNFKKAVAYALYANSTTVIVDNSFGTLAAGELVHGESSNCSANVVSQTTVNGKFTNNTITTISTPFVSPTVNASIVTLQVEDRTVTAEVVGSNTQQLGIYNIDASKEFISGSHAWVYATGSNTHANVVSISTGRVGGFEVGSLTDEEDLYVNPDIIDSKNSANVNFLTIKLSNTAGIGSNVGFVESVTVLNVGAGYSNSDVVVFTGGSPSTIAVATVNTYSNGSVESIVMSNFGAGYDSAPAVTITTSTGTNVDLQAVINPGYGFIKNPNGDINSIIDTCLRKTFTTVGTIASLTNIDPGANNTASPFVRIINNDLAGYGRRNYRLNISGNTKPFIIGETLTQEVYDPIITLNVTGLSAAFNSTQRETIKQTQAGGVVVYGEVISFTQNTAANTGVIRARYDGNTTTFNTSNTIVGLTSNATATVGSRTTSTTLQLAKGRIIANTSSSIDIFRTRFNTSFADNSQIFGSQSGATATINSIVEIDGSPIYGRNAIVRSPARSAGGTISKVEINNSGFGYTNNELVTIKSSNNVYVATGYARLYRQGTGAGYWEDTGGFLSSDQMIQDSEYYQDFSYEIQSSMSLDRYASVLKDTVHLAGTRTFGKVDRAALLDINIGTEDLNDRASYVSIVDGNNLQFQIGEAIAQRNGSTLVANGTIDSLTASITVNGANTEFIVGEQLSRPTAFANTSYGRIENVTYDFAGNTTTIGVNNVRGIFWSNSQVQTYFDRLQLSYTLKSSPTTFVYPEVVYQSNGSANVGVGNITSANATHLIIKPATRLSVSSITGTITPGDALYQRANGSTTNTAVGEVGLANSTVIEVIDPRGQFISGERAYVDQNNYIQIRAVYGKSDAFTKSNTVIMTINNLTDIGFTSGETITQPATGASGTLTLGNTSSISVDDVVGVFNSIDPVFGQTSGVQAGVSSVNGPFRIIGATSGANADISAIQTRKVLTTLTVNTSVGAINTLGISNVAGQFTTGGVLTGANSTANAVVTTVEIQAY